MQTNRSLFAVGWLVAGVAALGAMVRTQDDDLQRLAKTAMVHAPTQEQQTTATNVGSDIDYLQVGTTENAPLQFAFPDAGQSGRTILAHSRVEADELQLLLATIRKADTDADRAEAEKKLREKLVERFNKDVEQRRQQMERAAAKLKDMQAMLDKRIAMDEQIIDLQLQVMIQEREGMGWQGIDEPDAPADDREIFRFFMKSTR